MANCKGKQLGGYFPFSFSLLFVPAFLIDFVGGHGSYGVSQHHIYFHVLPTVDTCHLSPCLTPSVLRVPSVVVVVVYFGSGPVRTKQ